MMKGRPFKNPFVGNEAQQRWIILHSSMWTEQEEALSIRMNSKDVENHINDSSFLTSIVSILVTVHLFSLAVTKNQFKAARLLLKSGANVNAPGPEGQTPLVDAVLNNNAKVRFDPLKTLLRDHFSLDRWRNCCWIPPLIHQSSTSVDWMKRCPK